MKNPPLALLLALVALLLNACAPHRTLSLGNNPALVGQSILYRQTNNTETNVTLPGGGTTTTYQTDITDFRYTLRRVNANGSTDWEMQVLRRQSLENEDGKVTEQDSDHPTDTANLRVQMEQMLVRQVLRFTLAPDGSVHRFEGLDSVWAAVRHTLEQKESAGLSTFDALTTQMSDKNMGQLYGQTWGYLPPKPVKKGQKWSKNVATPPLNLGLQVTYRLLNYTPEKADIQLTSVIHNDEENPGELKVGPVTLLYYLDGKGTGTLDVDPATGLLRRSEQQTEMGGRMVVKMPFMLAQKTPLTIKSRTTVERLED
jgi:hypothetical protein